MYDEELEEGRRSRKGHPEYKNSRAFNPAIFILNYCLYSLRSMLINFSAMADL